jgi:integrase/recombinase XerC
MDVPGGEGEMARDLLGEHERDCTRRALQPGSIDKRMRLLRRIQNETEMQLQQMTTADLLGWLDGKRISAKTRYSYISHLSSFYRWAVLEGRVRVDPTLRLSRPKLRPGLPRPLAGGDEMAELIDQAPTAELAAMIYLAGHVGLRCMEIAGLDGPEVLFHQQPPVVVVLNGKGGRHRIVPMSADVARALRHHGVPPVGPVFRDELGDRLQPWKVSRVIREHMQACGVNGSAHQLRHTFATAVYRRSGGDLRMTQELLGHASPSTTAIYTQWSQDRAAGVVDGLYGQPPNRKTAPQ